MGIPPYNELKTISSGLVVAVFSECLLFTIRNATYAKQMLHALTSYSTYSTQLTIRVSTGLMGMIFGTIWSKKVF